MSKSNVDANSNNLSPATLSLTGLKEYLTGGEFGGITSASDQTIVHTYGRIFGSVSSRKFETN